MLDRQHEDGHYEGDWFEGSGKGEYGVANNGEGDGTGDHRYGRHNSYSGAMIAGRDLAIPDAYGEIESDSNSWSDVGRCGSGCGYEYADSNQQGSGCSSLEDPAIPGWYFNYTVAKNEGVPEIELDLELVADPTLRRFED